MPKKIKAVPKTEYMTPDEVPTFVERLMKSCGSAALAVASFLTLGFVAGEGDPRIYVAYLEGLGMKLAEKLHINLTAPPGFVGVASIANANGVSVVEASPSFFEQSFANRVIGAILSTLVANLGNRGGGTLMLNVPSGQNDTEAYVSTDGTTWHRVVANAMPVACMRFVPNTQCAIAIGRKNGEILMIDTGDSALLAGKRTKWKTMGSPFGDAVQVAFLSRVKPDGTVIATSESGAKATLKINADSATYAIIGGIDTSSPNTVTLAALDFDSDAAIRAQTGIAHALRGRAPTAIALDYLPPSAAPDDTSATAATS